MSPTHVGHDARFGGSRHRIRPILSSPAQLSPRRSVVAVPTARTGGVGSPSERGGGTASVAMPPAVEEAAGLAFQTLDLLERRSHEVAEGFRWNRVAEANAGLGELVQSTQLLLRLAMAMAGATGVDLASACVVDGARVDEGTRTAVDRLITKQLAADWLAVAETIDEDLAPAIARWRSVFEALDPSPDDHGGRAA